jgi:O-methyltransferase/8-demethyl-8-(2,3-dimethoxy-alpha-L-rhamnosyl)tetracenomycin-C 4'-O-methyltransferase
MARYHIAIIRPDGYLHSECFREVGETLDFALRSLGHEVGVGENTIDALAANIILGAHLLTKAEAQRLPATSVVYNLEQLGNASLPDWYMGLAARVKVWDYSPLNLERWKQGPCLHEPALVEIGFAPVLRRIPIAPVQDIDVLFYGSLNQRRNVILRALYAAGLKLHVSFGVYGLERDALISRAKVVLNMHAYETEIFEVVRVSYLLANGKAVVSETAPDIGTLEAAVAACPYDQLVSTCIALVVNESERHGLEARGFRAFSTRSQAGILTPIVGTAKAPVAAAPVAGVITVPNLRTLYLDMVQRCVINTIYEDPNGDRWSPHTYDRQLRELGRDWPAQAHSMIGNARMTNLRGIAEFVLENHVPGDFIETGVWRGGACILMRAILKAYGDTGRRVWVADSFCGLPAPKPGLAGDSGDQHHTFSELIVSSKQVRSNFASYDLLDDQVQFLEGWFSETLRTAPIEQLAILRLDGDMYESTMDALGALFDKVVPGGFVIVDDFGAVAGCRQAILEFRASRGITDVMHDIDGFGSFWRKESLPWPQSAAELLPAVSMA